LNTVAVEIWLPRCWGFGTAAAAAAAAAAAWALSRLLKGPILGYTTYMPAVAAAAAAAAAGVGIDAWNGVVRAVVAEVPC